MNIINISYSLSQKGFGIYSYLKDLCYTLGSTGNSVCVLGVDDDEFNAAEWNSTIATTFQADKIPFIGSSTSLIKYIRTVSTENTILHIHGLWLAVLYGSGFAFNKKGGHYVLSPHGMLEDWALNYSKIRKKIVLFLFESYNIKNASCIFATSDEEMISIRKIGYKGPVAVIPIGIRTQEYIEAYDKRYKKDKKKLLFMSRIHPKKGLPLLFEALRGNTDFLDTWELIIAGPGEEKYKTFLKEKALACGIDNNIQWVGNVSGERKKEIISSADCFILPSYSENFGIVVLEALASGIPVITTKGTPWEILEKEKCGWWVNIGVEPIDHSIREAISLSDAERFEMGKRGRQFVERDFDWQKIAQDMLSVYQWILKQGPKPDCVRLY